MRIAFVLGSFPALSETFILNQITGLLDRGHAIDIYATGPRDDPKCHPDVERYRLIGRTFYMKVPLSARLRSFALRALAEPGEIWEALRRRVRPDRSGPSMAASLSSPPARQYDIVHCHFGESGLTALTHRNAGELAGKLVTTFYGADLTRHLVDHGDDSYAELFKRGDAFLAICDYFGSRLIAIGCPPDRLRKHALGIDPSRFPFIPRRLPAGDTIRLVTIARLVEKKGVEYALRALARIRTATPIEYTIIGDGALRGALERLAQGVSSNVSVRFTGWLQQEEVAATLRGAHLLLAPSVTASDGDQEGTPVAILEALASGLPVISTWHSGIPEVVQDGTSGRLVPERDAAALADAIDDLAGIAGPVARDWGAGRTHVEHHHDINKLNDELVRLYERLLGPSGAVNPPELGAYRPTSSGRA